MCGILGWFGELPPDRAVFKRALATLQHRGPDGTGTYFGSHVYLGHVRLAVIDPSSGHQPWTDSETGSVLVYNGELYNYLEEREILRAKGHHFATNTDTEVVMKMYCEYGESMLARMIGMFAFAVFDPRRNALFCARDHFGIKPFYFYKDRNENFYFTSEVKALVNMGLELQSEEKAIADYIALQYILGEKTFFKDVFRLLPGHCLWVETDGKQTIKQYWSIEPEESFHGSFDEAAETVRQLLDNAVELQLRSDVPLGSHLSGGIDSAVITSRACRKIHPRPMHTFTAAFSEGGVYDDSFFANVSATHIGTKHHLVYPTDMDFMELYGRIAWHLDEPMAAEGVFPQYIVSRLAKSHVTVVLGGQGADEIFGGYARYYAFLMAQASSNGNCSIGVTFDELRRSLSQLSSYMPLVKKLREGDLADPAMSYWRLIDRSEDGAPLTSEFKKLLAGYSPFETFKGYFDKYPKAEMLNRILYFETSCWLPALLHVEDRVSMALSLESRVPFLDPRLVKFLFTLPTGMKMKDGRTKSLLRVAFDSDLAPEVCNRQTKIGFPAPVNQWFNTSLREYVDSILTRPDSLKRGIYRPEILRSWSGRHNGHQFDRTLWGMLNVELWHRNLLPTTVP